MHTIRKQLKFAGGQLFLCDMRPGFSEDGIGVSLPKGDYQLSIEPSPDEQVRGFSLVLTGQKPDAEVTRGTLTLDMATVGVFDRKRFSKVFAGDGEALFEWSGDVSGKRDLAWGGFLKHKQSGLDALYVVVGADCKCAVRALRSRSQAVGVRVAPGASPKRKTDERGSRHWTWVELKCQGIGDPWSCCDDRDYAPDPDLLLDNILFQVGCVGSDSSSGKVDPDKAISHYTSRYGGVTNVSVFYERAGEPRRRIQLPQVRTLPKLGSEATPRQVTKVVLALFKQARESGEQTGCTERRNRISADNRTSLARRR